MLVRHPRGHRSGGVTSPHRPLARLVVLAVAGALATAACRSTATPRAAVEITSRLEPSPARVGPFTVALSVKDARAEPVRGATLRIEGHMAHPGMTPVLATAIEHAPGVYRADATFSMPGDWTLLALVRLADGSRLEHRIEVVVVQGPS